MATDTAESADAPPPGGSAPDEPGVTAAALASTKARMRRDTLVRVGRSPYALWGGFVLVHTVLWLCALLGGGMPLGDVTIVYLPWAQEAHLGYAFMGITAPWVYPVLAMVPILIPLIAGPDNYVVAWLTMVTVFNAAAFAVLAVRGRPRGILAAWWWLAFLLLLGPIAIGRLDAVSVSIVIVALVWLSAHPRVASVLLAVATWIKVWPAGVILAVLVVVRRRWRVLGYVLATSAAIALVAIAFGGASELFSFVLQQGSRGLQIEAPISAPWLWAAALHAPGSSIYYDIGLLTFQVTGWNIDVPIALMNPALGVAVTVIVLIGLRAVVRKAPTSVALPQLMLALVTALIAFNKVGSPQYIAWLAGPVVLGLLMSGRRFATPALLVTITAALTQAFYPYLYVQVLSLNAWMLAVLTLRNVMVFVVLGWSIAALWRTGRPRVRDRVTADVSDAESGGTPYDTTSGTASGAETVTSSTSSGSAPSSDARVWPLTDPGPPASSL